MEPEEKKVDEVVVKAAVEKVEEDVQSEETAGDDRPERNWKAELERKNREIERLRQVAESEKSRTVSKRDPADVSTWADHELKAIVKSNDPSVLPFKDQAEDVLLERKVQSLREKERMQEKRALSDLEIRAKFPDALDPSSELSLKMEQVMYDYDLQKSPAGRLAAAKIAAAELGKGHSKSKAQERDSENRRIADVKSKMVDGDRSKATGGKGPSNLEDIEKRTRSEGIMQTDGFKEAMKIAGLDRDTFFPKK